MSEAEPASMWHLASLLFKAHPWHGISIGEEAPETLTAFIEIVPTDTVKYELDKVSGYLKVDRPQQFSNVYPSLYGLIPQTFCGRRLGDLCAQRAGRDAIVGDGDPLDICVLTEKTITMGNILVQAIPIGGLRLIDRNEADDKIIAVMKGDLVYGGWRDLQDCPQTVIDRLEHYFLTYKQTPEGTARLIEIAGIYGRDEAHEVIRTCQADYMDRFSDMSALLEQALRG